METQSKTEYRLVLDPNFRIVLFLCVEVKANISNRHGSAASLHDTSVHSAGRRAASDTCGDK
jgi:hypothetical protein